MAYNRVISYSEFIANINPFGLYNTINLSDSTINTNSYDKKIKYSLRPGMYLLKCTGYYFALLNYAKTDSIIYQGILTLKSDGPDLHSYIYYKDVIVITVLSNFGYITVDVKGQNFKGNNILTYSN
jgi:hypothetical protein